MDQREVELIDYLRILWRQKWIIAVTFLTAVIAAWGASHAIAPIFQTETSLLLLPPLSSQLDAVAVGSQLAPETYRELAVSTSLLKSIREAAGLPADVEIDALRHRFSVSVRRFTSDAGGAQYVLKATIRGSDPERLPEIAVAWTAAFTEKFGELFEDRTSRSYHYVSENYAETEADLELLVEERTNLLAEYPITILQAELTALLSQEAGNRARLANAYLEYDVAVAQVAALETERAAQPLFFRLSSSMAPDSLIAAIAAGLSARDIEALADLRIETEHLNDTYVSLNTKHATQRVLLEELEEEIAKREASAVEQRSALMAKQRELTEAQAALDSLDRRIGILNTQLDELAASLQDARLALAETPEPIRVIDEPLVPSFPVAPKKKTNIAVAGFLGLMVGILLAFFVDYLGKVREQESAFKPEGRDVSQNPHNQQANDKANPSRQGQGEDSPP